MNDRHGREIFILGFLLIVTLSLLVFNFVHYAKQNEIDENYLNHASELRVLSQSIAKHAVEASDGNESAFRLLHLGRDQFAKRLKILAEGDATLGFPPTPLEIQDKELKYLKATWRENLNAVDVILANEKSILMLNESIRKIEEALPALRNDFEEILDKLVIQNAPATVISSAAKQVSLLERISSSTSRILSERSDVILAAKEVIQNVVLFEHVLEGLLFGDRTLEIPKIIDRNVVNVLKKARVKFSVIANNHSMLTEKTQQLADAKQAAEQIYLNSGLLLIDTTDLNNGYVQIASNRFIGPVPGTLLGCVAVLLLILIGYRLHMNTKSRLKEIKQQKEAHQQAVYQLQSELADFADGNLTISATKNSDFTAPIAQSFNFAIEALRRTVSSINMTVINVVNTSKKSEKVAKQLVVASLDQKQSVDKVTEAVTSMAVSIQQVSSNAKACNEVADESVQNSEEGVRAVDNVIHSMNAIEERIETTKSHLESLGQRSDEIGTILKLISEIAEQTNILSLNATIQASQSESGSSGYMSVSDKVTLLAERTAKAATEIRHLILHIQNDTSKAIDAIRESSNEVNQGVSVAKKAGTALDTIKNVSLNLATLIDEISSASESQANAASDIAKSMVLIDKITEETAGGVEETSSALKQLAEYVRVLSQSVSGFKLPGPVMEKSA